MFTLTLHVKQLTDRQTDRRTDRLIPPTPTDMDDTKFGNEHIVTAGVSSCPPVCTQGAPLNGETDISKQTNRQTNEQTTG